MPDYLKVRSEPVTQARFDLLPALLTAYQVKLVTGLNDNDLSALVQAGTIDARKGPVKRGRKKSYSKYTKVSVGKFVGYKV